MRDETIVMMINEYLQEPNSIDRKWVEALQICKELLENRIGSRHIGREIVKEYVKGETNK